MSEPTPKDQQRPIISNDDSTQTVTNFKTRKREAGMQIQVRLYPPAYGSPTISIDLFHDDNDMSIIDMSISDMSIIDMSIIYMSIIKMSIIDMLIFIQQTIACCVVLQIRVHGDPEEAGLEEGGSPH
jgi:hypothetical protein